MTNISPLIDSFDQEVDHEGRYFDNLKDLAENELADPGEEFTVEVELVPAAGYFHTDRTILIREGVSTLGTLPHEATETWWQLACAMYDANEVLEANAQIWTSPDWDERFYASVRLSLPTRVEALQEIEDDYVTLTEENLDAHENFTNEVIDHFVPAWRQAHNMTDEQYQAEVDKTQQELIDMGYKFDESGKMVATPDRQLTYPPAASTPARPDTSAWGLSSTTTTGDSLGRANALAEYEGSRKKGIVAWLLWLFLGGFGGHRFYFGHTGYAVAMLLLNWLTLGLWALIDALFINRNLRRINTEKWVSLATRYRTPVEPLPASTQ